MTTTMRPTIHHRVPKQGPLICEPAFFDAAPLTSEPPFADAAPLTSEPPLADAAPSPASRL